MFGIFSHGRVLLTCTLPPPGSLYLSMTVVVDLVDKFCLSRGIVSRLTLLAAYMQQMSKAKPEAWKRSRVWVEPLSQETRWMNLHEQASTVPLPPPEMALAGERVLRHRKLKVCVCVASTTPGLEEGVLCAEFEGEVPLFLFPLRQKPRSFAVVYRTGTRFDSEASLYRHVNINPGAFLS